MSTSEEAPQGSPWARGLMPVTITLPGDVEEPLVEAVRNALDELTKREVVRAETRPMMVVHVPVSLDVEAQIVPLVRGAGAPAGTRIDVGETPKTVTYYEL